ncbi:Integral membrane protein [Streptococcus sp. DD10]|uniref:YitT family protein n=1 Tax=Streptococcus sp. DD10 TaxID=1777878 RepID=UPI00079935CB|nr:YitT family protein [Streptococcus sp. DD10]KXT72779.1 Integral membrane protein [Streptococcus sp. DD10]
MKKTSPERLLKLQVKRAAKRFKLLQVLKSISKEKYDEKISASIVYGFLSAVAVNFFFQPGNVYSSGATGLAQVLTALSSRFLGFTIPVSVTFYAINIPLMLLAWYQIGHKFTIFTFITVSMSSLFIQIVPVVTLTNDPIINALFGGVVMGLGIGFALRNNISSGGTDIVSLTVRKRTGRNVGSISLIVNGTIMLIAGVTFGWKYALYSMITIFVSSRVTDAIFTKQKKMQAMIVTSHPEKVIAKIHKRLQRGATIINDAEGTYNHQHKAVLITVITRAEYNEFKYIMKKSDPDAFVSISDNVHILGRFVELDK